MSSTVYGAGPGLLQINLFYDTNGGFWASINADAGWSGLKHERLVLPPIQ